MHTGKKNILVYSWLSLAFYLMCHVGCADGVGYRYQYAEVRSCLGSRPRWSSVWNWWHLRWPRSSSSLNFPGRIILRGCHLSSLEIGYILMLMSNDLTQKLWRKVPERMQPLLVMWFDVISCSLFSVYFLEWPWRVLSSPFHRKAVPCRSLPPHPGSCSPQRSWALDKAGSGIPRPQSNPTWPIMTANITKC